MRRIASLLALAATFLAGAGAARAAWLESGDVVANSALFNETYPVGSAGHSSVCSDMRGGLITAWWENAASTPDSLVINRLNRAGSRVWNGATGVTVGPFEGSNSAITVLSDGDGGAWVAYTIDFSGTGFTVGTYAQHYDANGVATIAFPGVRVGANSTGVASGSPLADVTPSGKLVVMMLTQGPIGGTDVLRVQRVTQAGALEWGASGLQVGASTQAGNDIQAFRILADGEGAVGVWTEETNSTGPARVRATRVSSAGAESWTAGGETAYENATFDVLSADAIWDAVDGLTIVFSASDLANTPSKDLFVTRLTTAGAVNASWGSTSTAKKVVDNTTTGAAARGLGITTDGGSGCLVVWEDNRNSSVTGPGGVNFLIDIRAQHYSATGSTLWTSGGVAVDVSENNQFSPCIVPDDAGGAYIGYTTWPRATGAVDQSDDVVLKHLDATGATTWTRFHGGATQSATDDGQQFHVQLARDGSGGVDYAWSTDVSSQDAFANHRSSTGAVFVGSIALTFPNGGETLPSMNHSDITWTSNYGGQVKLEYAINNGARTTIATATPDDGTFSWLVPTLNSTQVTVYVTVVNDTPADQSANFFTICPTIDADVTWPTIGTSPQGVATGDFNEDGILDLAIPTATGATVLRGGGVSGVANGTFGTVTQVTAGGTGHDVAVADLDGDGVLDLVIGHSLGVTYYFGNGTAGVGNGTFGAANPIVGFGSVGRVAVADMDGDGVPDIVGSMTGLDLVQIFYGTRVGATTTFDAGHILQVPVANQPEGLAIADFDRDGALDFAVVSTLADSLTIRLGNGPGAGTRRSYAPAIRYATPDAPHDVVSGDFNEDGFVDLAVAADGTGVGGETYRGLGNGSFAAGVAVKVSSVMQRLATADMNRDGIADLVFTTSTGAVQIAWGDGTGTIGDGTFTPGGFQTVGTSPVGLAIGDFDEDNHADVAVANSGNNNVSVMLAGCGTPQASGVVVTAPNGGSTFAPGTTTTISWTRSAATIAVDVDLSRDGGVNWERLASNVVGNSFSWRVSSPPTTAARVRVTDAALFDRTDMSNSNFTICDPLGAASTVTLVTAGQNAATLADANEDGHQDLFVTAPGSFSFRPGTGAGTFGAALTRTAAGAGTALRTADFDEDGILDVVEATTAGVQVFRGLGSGGLGNGTYAAATVLSPARSMPDVRVADLNEDGIADLVAVSTDDTMWVWLGNGANGTGDGTFTQSFRRSVSGRPTGLVLADFNEDGILDAAVSTDLGTFGVDVALGQGAGGHGNGTFATFTHYPATYATHALVAGDLDEDGILDLAATSSEPTLGTNLGGVVLFKGQGAAGVGNGTFASMTWLDTTTPHEQGLALADMNADGRVDLVASTFDASSSLDGVAILYGLGSGTTGNGTFAPAEISTALTTPADVVVGDLDEDQQPDVVVVDPSTGVVARMLGGCSVTGAGVTVASPNGGDFLQVGTTATISWTRTPSVPAVDVEVSRDGGASWERIAEGVTGTSFPWEVTGPYSVNARVRVLDSTRPLVKDASDADFVIYITPNGAEQTPLPTAVAFSAARPNPSRGPVRFALELPGARDVRVELFDAAGRRVRTLADGTFGAGRHALAWDGRDEQGAPAAPGVYLVRARAEGLDVTRRVIRVE